MSSPLVNKVLPPRIAAKRASANLAEQLDSENDEIYSKSKANKRKTRSRVDSLPTRRLKRSASPVSSDETDISLLSQPKSPLKFEFTIPSDTILDEEEIWTLAGIIDYCFVFVNESGQVYTREQEVKDYLWWPAKVIKKTADAIKVAVFGMLKPGLKEIHIPSPSKDNTLSFLDKYRTPRFSSTYHIQPSPRKKSRRAQPSVHERWATALKLAFEQINDDDDGLPDVGIALSDFSTSIYRRSHDGATTTTSGAESSEEEETSEFLDFDFPTIVYAHGRHNRADYWPARVLEYIPGKRKKAGRYKVQFVDNTVELIPRDWFYLDTDDGFGLCRLGTFDTQALDDPDDVDEDEPSEREPSPAPLHPPPNAEDFCSLDIREQFAYVKPVLQAILNNKYPPAKANHDAFLAGGRSRELLSNEAGLRGLLTVRDSEQLQKYLDEWCLRSSQKAKENDEAEVNDDPALSQHDGPKLRASPAPTVEDLPTPPPMSFISYDGSVETVGSSGPADVGVPSPAPESQLQLQLQLPSAEESQHSEVPAPQRGCPEYNSLSHVEKMKYVLDVLFLEAKRQILLWQAGHRSTPELLTDSEEQQLFDKGRELLEQTDWVRDAQRLRAAKERQLEKAGKLVRKDLEPHMSDRALRAARR